MTVSTSCDSQAVGALGASDVGGRIAPPSDARVAHGADLFYAAAEAVLVVNERGTVLRANARAAALFGEQVTTGTCACDSLFALDRDAPLTETTAVWPEVAARARAGDFRARATVRCVDQDTIHAELIFWPVAPPPSALTAVLVRDRGEAMRLERRTRELERRLQQSQQVEAIGRLAGGIAHDFNNLLTIIAGYAELLAGSPTVDPDDRVPLGQVREAADRAAELTGQLLAFSRQSATEPALVDLNRLVRRESDMLRRVVDEDIEFVTRFAPRLPLVRCDAGRFSQVVMNLVLNARDAMPSGGRLSVATSVVIISDADADHPDVTRPGQYALLTVEDSGCGMSAEEIERVFEPFFTTKGEGTGTGLGMTTVHGIVADSGGFIAIESSVGIGTTVRVYLPAATHRTPVRGIDAVERSGVDGFETVLLVEDNAAVRALAEAVLTDHGYTVIAAADGDEAVHQLDLASSAVHLVVSDVVMPNRNGRAVVSHAQRLDPGIKALYLSGYTEDAIVRQGILRDDVAFLQKPFTPDALLRAVREALDS